MFSIFKRDKSNENKDVQPMPEPNQPVPDSTETTAPVNPAETSIGEPSAPPATPSPTPEAESPENASQTVVESSPPPQQKAPVASIPLESVPGQKPRKSLAYRLFSPETRLGRFNRPVLRWLGAITGLFALGLLTGYILLYQPAQRELDAALARLAATDQLITQKQQGLQSAQTGLDQAQLSVKQIQDKLDAAQSENTVLIVMVDVSNARVALAGKDGAAAKTAIEQAQSKLKQALPYLESQDKVLVDLLTSRLDLIAKELVSDPSAAQSDLGKLSTDLTNLHQKIFGE